MNVNGYGLEEAELYDDISEYNKGFRQMHKQFLIDALEFLKFRPKNFLDLGCGTGYFAETIYNVYPYVEGTMIDASNEMLQIAQRKFFGKKYKMNFIQAFLQDLDWENLGKFDIIFSALTIHHLQDDQKWELFRNIHKYLNEGGVFILFDLFKSRNEFSSELLEYLACKDCQRKLINSAGIVLDEFEISKLITEDRRIRKKEGDKEAYLDDQLRNLELLGFENVTTIFQEARFMGTVTFK